MKSFQILSFTLERVLEKSELIGKNKEYRNQLEQKVEEQVNRIMNLQNQLISTQKEVIFRLGDVIEARSGETGYHVQRVAEPAGLLGKIYGLDGEVVEKLVSAAPMHDIGKIGIEDAILNKPGRLTDDEMTIMKTHAQIGYDILNGSRLPMLQLAAEVALNHHEKWDGTGYPTGISGENIPISARIVTLTDVFDTISHSRIYKPAWSLEDSFEFIKENSGKIFDPKLVELFLSHKDEFLTIRKKLNPNFIK